MFPDDTPIVIPTFQPIDCPPLTREDIRARGKVVSRSGDGTRGTCQVIQGRVVCFCAVLLNADGTIDDFAPRPGVGRKVTYVGTFNEFPPL